MNSRFFFALLCFCFSIVTQAAVVKGVVGDSTDRQPLVSHILKGPNLSGYFFH